jgi:transcriptional regulator with XRE-family HTH domain
MELHDEDTARTTPRTVLGRRLKRLREASGLSLRALADELTYTHTYLSRVERGEQLPSAALAETLDQRFGADGLFAELLELARDASIPGYGRAIINAEEKATRIQIFTSSLIPGWFQTEEYARELFRVSNPGDEEEKISERVEMRMSRKKIITRKEAPLFWAIIDEAALKRPMGSNKCMADQVMALLDAARLPHVTIQVLPFTQRQHPMLGGSLSLLTLQNGSTIGYAESFIHGESMQSPQWILALTQRFDVARAKALPEEETIDLLRSYLKDYEDDDDS